MTFHYEREYAAEFGGSDAASIIYEFVWWCRRLRLQNEHQLDGRTWIYYGIEALHTLYPWIPTRTLRRILDRLVDAGVLVRATAPQRRTLNGTCGRDIWLQTAWYAFVDEARFLGPLDAAKMAQPEAAEAPCHAANSAPSCTESLDSSMDVPVAATAELAPNEAGCKGGALPRAAAAAASAQESAPEPAPHPPASPLPPASSLDSAPRSLDKSPSSLDSPPDAIADRLSQLPGLSRAKAETLARTARANGRGLDYVNRWIAQSERRPADKRVGFVIAMITRNEEPPVPLSQAPPKERENPEIAATRRYIAELHRPPADPEALRRAEEEAFAAIRGIQTQWIESDPTLAERRREVRPDADAEAEAERERRARAQVDRWRQEAYAAA